MSGLYDSSFEERIGKYQRCKLLLSDDRIFEKTSCSPQFGIIRKFVLPNLYNQLSNFFGRNRSRIQSQSSYTLLYIVVLESRKIVECLFSKNKSHCGDQYVGKRLFENTRTITKTTLLIGSRMFLLRDDIYAFYFIDNIFGFLAICSDISYRSCTYLARNQYQIFSSYIAMLQASHESFVSIFASTYLEIDTSIIFFDNLFA